MRPNENRFDTMRNRHNVGGWTRDADGIARRGANGKGETKRHGAHRRQYCERGGDDDDDDGDF